MSLMSKRSLLVLSLVTFATALLACPHHEETPSHTEYKAQENNLSPWMRAAHTGKNTAAYLPSFPSSIDPQDILLGASADFAEKVELHEHVNEQGVMKMRPVKSMAVQEGDAFMRPGGRHIMMMNLKKDLKEGDTYSLNLTFEKAGTITLPFIVK